MLIPSRSFVLLALVPLALAVITPLDRSMVWPMLAADLAIVVIAAVDALLARRPLVTVRRTAPEVFSLGRQNLIRLELRSQARRKLRVRVTTDLFDHARAEGLPLETTLPPRGRETLAMRVVPRRRGSHVLGAMHVRYPSPLGLWQRQITTDAQDAVRVYPDVQAVRTWELLARQDRQHSLMRTSRRVGGENEFEQLRDYTRDDEFRSIDWKATARRSKLIARQYQLESNQNLMFVLDAGRLMTAESAGISQFDHALNASLMLGHVAVRGGDRIGLLAYGDAVRRFLPPTRGRQAVQKLIQATYDLHPELVEPDHAQAMQTLQVRVRSRSLVVLFTQVIDEHSAKEIVRLARSLTPRHLPLFVIFKDADVEELLDPTARAKEGAELDLYVRGAAAELVSWRDGVIRELRGQGTLVLDVDPSQLTAELINRYLEIKARHLL